MVKGDIKRWRTVEKEKLRIGVISENKRILFNKFKEQKDDRAIAALSMAPDSEMTVNPTGLDWGRISKQFVSPMDGFGDYFYSLFGQITHHFSLSGTY